MKPLTATWFRSLLVQASFNYDRMIAVGAAWAIQPLLRSLPKDRYHEAMRRSTQFFNAHPYLVGMAMSAVARTEQDGLSGDMVRRLRHALISPLGSVGDKLIWAGLIPFSVGVGLTVGALLSPIAGMIVFLVLYNAAHFALRTWALREGWRQGRAVARALTAKGIQRGMRIAGPLGGLVVGFAIPVVGGWLAREFTLHQKLGIGMVGVLALAFAQWILPSFRGIRFGLVVAAVAFVVGWAV
jgi:mannose/fructose/N-acetylgalactosamine-specific phosphotransferase system component IID